VSVGSSLGVSFALLASFEFSRENWSISFKNISHKYSDMGFSTRSMHLLIKNQTGKRVSKQAADLLDEKLGEFGSRIAEEAVKIAQEDAYQTVQAKHIQDALDH
jgi:histone H3/H4